MYAIRHFSILTKLFIKIYIASYLTCLIKCKHRSFFNQTNFLFAIHLYENIAPKGIKI